MSKKPKIEVISQPRDIGGAISMSVRFNYKDISRRYSFTISNSNIENEGLESVLKRLYEEKRPGKVDKAKLNIGTEIDW